VCRAPEVVVQPPSPSIKSPVIGLSVCLSVQLYLFIMIMLMMIAVSIIMAMRGCMVVLAVCYSDCSYAFIGENVDISPLYFFIKNLDFVSLVKAEIFKVQVSSLDLCSSVRL